ncbi:GDSL-type esterase/lipase family protein [Microbacterium sp. zg.B48]|uniref:SGNH/GDSL hydrolase family protein n=1 Tax=Microbacterium sp. zg.B48 TaxID=2969408 RepID=UPI00214AA6A3|nr:SGNH/GDSL hydrolase family protein [Microbacterium sp. zg.B48]MCR2764351.1 GDSL-type esterase/lipase family protein [Microbacterium sp. zg.B48]
MTDVRDLLRGTLPSLDWNGGSRLPDASRVLLPSDTVATAGVPAGVHFSIVGTAEAVEVRFRRGEPTWRPAPTLRGEFVVYTPDGSSTTAPLPRDADVAVIELPARSEGEVIDIHLPETIQLRFDSVVGVGGALEPAPQLPRWVVYGDSITQGWSVSRAGLGWASLSGRRLGRELINLGFARAARGELAAADVIGASQADAVALAWGTNSYSTLPADTDLIAATMRTFLTAVRQGLPDAPIAVISPVLRADAEFLPNRFGATQSDLRSALEDAVREFAAATGDGNLLVIPGLDLVPADRFVADRVHPDDAGHVALAQNVSSRLERFDSALHVKS